VVEAVRLSRSTFRKIVQNLFWAWFYNVAAIPIAALGLLHPMVGVIAMTASSLSVIGNSLLLKWVRLGMGATSEATEREIQLKDGSVLRIKKSGALNRMDAEGQVIEMKDGESLEATDGTVLMLKDHALWQQLH